MRDPLKDKKIVFSDLDGTIYLGNELIEGAREFLDRLDNKGIRTYFLSNNSSRSKSDYVKKLARLGIKATPKDIILSTDGVIDFLIQKKVKRTYIVGTQSMIDMFAEAGIDPDSPAPEYVVLGFDTELVYEKLKKAAFFLLDDIPLLATHPDLVCPTPKGPIPDIGAMLALFEKATGKKAFKIFGKPNVEMVQHVMKRHQVSAREVVMVGDRLYTDMELANRLGCDFFLVLSGETTAKEAAHLKKKPAVVAENAGKIIPS